MSTDVDESAEQSTASLITGIFGDLQDLVEQQLLLARREMESEIRQRLSALGVVALGVMILFLHAITLCLSMVHLLHWLASSSQSDPGWLPLWGCHATVAIALLLLGGLVTHRGKTMLESFDSRLNPVKELVKE